VLKLSECLTGDVLRVALVADEDHLRFHEPLAEVLRGSLLTDMALLGRLTADAQGSQVDTTPTGLGILDEMLNGVVEHPHRTMEWWLRLGRPHLHELIAELLEEGCWLVERHGVTSTFTHYVDVEEDRIAGIRSGLQAVIAGGRQPANAREAALACLSSKVGSVPEPDKARLEHLLPECGGVGWMVRNVIDYEVAAREDDVAAGAADSRTTLAQFGGIGLHP